MSGTKFTTLDKNRSKWEQGQYRFQPMVHALAPGSNPWKDAEKSLKKHMTPELAKTYGMTKKEANEYMRQNSYLQRTKEFYTQSRGTPPPSYYGPCN